MSEDLEKKIEELEDINAALTEANGNLKGQVMEQKNRVFIAHQIRDIKNGCDLVLRMLEGCKHQTCVTSPEGKTVCADCREVLS